MRFVVYNDLQRTECILNALDYWACKFPEYMALNRVPYFQQTITILNSRQNLYFGYSPLKWNSIFISDTIHLIESIAEWAFCNIFDLHWAIIGIEAFFGDFCWVAALDRFNCM